MYLVSLASLGRGKLFSPRFLVQLTLISMLVGVLFELLVAKTPLPVFLVRVGLGTIIVSLFLYIYGKLLDRFVSSVGARVWLNGTVVFFAGVGRSFLMYWVEGLVFGVALPGHPFRPIIAGSGLYFSFACLALVVGIRKEYVENAQRFALLSKEIEQFRITANKRINDESKKLRRRAQDSLLPLFSRLEQQLNEFAAPELLTELRGLLTENIRPLSEKLSKQEELRIRTKRLVVPKPRSFAAIPPKFRIASAIYPNLNAVLVGPTLMSVAIYVYGWGAVVPYLGLLILSWLFGKAFSFIVPRRPINTVIVVLVSLTYSALLWDAMLLALSFIMTGKPVETAVLLAVIFPAMALGITLMLVSFFAGNVKTNYDQIEKLEHEAGVYKSLVNQKLWISRRNWSYLIHGTVQSSVTLALTRLTGIKGKLPGKVMKDLRKDLQTARQALELEITTEVDLASSIDSLISTWKGVCEISIELTPEVAHLTASPSELNFGLNELLKEMVSNGFRHGQATKFAITISKAEEKLLRIVSINDGLPVPEDFKTNIGVAMYNELGVNWSIVSPNPKKGAVLTVDVAI